MRYQRPSPFCGDRKPSSKKSRIAARPVRIPLPPSGRDAQTSGLSKTASSA